MAYPKLTPIVTTGATEPRYIGDRFADLVNVKDFGAKGDGITDDTDAFESAVGTGCFVYVPSGSYLVEKKFETAFVSDGHASVTNNVIVPLGMSFQSSYFKKKSEFVGYIPHDNTGGIVGTHVWQQVNYDKFDDVLYVQHSPADRTNRMYFIKDYINGSGTKKLDGKSANIVQVFSHQNTQLYRPKASDPVRWFCLGDTASAEDTSLDDLSNLKLVAWSWSDGEATPQRVEKYWKIPDYIIESNGNITRQIRYARLDPTQQKIALAFCHTSYSETPNKYDIKIYSVSDILSLDSGTSLSEIEEKSENISFNFGGIGQDMAWDGVYFYGLNSGASTKTSQMFVSDGTRYEAFFSSIGLNYKDYIDNNNVPSAIEGETLFWMHRNGKTELWLQLARKYYPNNDTTVVQQNALMYNLSTDLDFRPETPEDYCSSWIPFVGRALNPLQLLQQGYLGLAHHATGTAASDAGYDGNLPANAYVGGESFSLTIPMGWDDHSFQINVRGSDPRYMSFTRADFNAMASGTALSTYYNIVDQTPFIHTLYGTTAYNMSKDPLFTGQTDNLSFTHRLLSKRDTLFKSGRFITTHRSNANQGSGNCYVCFLAQENENYATAYTLQSVFTAPSTSDGVETQPVAMNFFASDGIAKDANHVLSITAKNLGTNSFPWSNVYASSGPWSSSDARKKDNIENPSDALMRAWGKVNFKIFQMKDAIQLKGENARLHVGVIAQEVAEAFASEGLDAGRYGLFGYDKWEDQYEEDEVVDVEAVIDESGNEVTPAQKHIERKLVQKAGDTFYIRYEEALALECAYQRWRLEQLEERVNQLTNNNNN